MCASKVIISHILWQLLGEVYEIDICIYESCWAGKSIFFLLWCDLRQLYSKGVSIIPKSRNFDRTNTCTLIVTLPTVFNSFQVSKFTLSWSSEAKKTATPYLLIDFFMLTWGGEKFRKRVLVEYDGTAISVCMCIRVAMKFNSRSGLGLCHDDRKYWSKSYLSCSCFSNF